MRLPIELLDRSCALAWVAGEPKGTAFLVAPDLAVTCAHVVGQAAPEGTRLAFVRGPDAPVVAIERHPEDDIAVLVLSKAVDAPTLRIAPACREHSTWRTFGFPRRAHFEGRPFSGSISHPSVSKSGKPRVLLFSNELAAGFGTPVHGLSGAPIVVGDRVVGMAAEIQTDEAGLGPQVVTAAWGHVFAIPSAHILARLGARVQAAESGLPPPHPEMRLAARVGVAKVREALSQLEMAGAGDPGATLAGAEALIALGEPHAAIEVLGHCPASDRREQLLGLALAKSGRKDDAILILEKLFQRGLVDAETGGILGGRYKEAWFRTPRNRALLDRAYQVYAEAYRGSGDPYPGINVAAIALYQSGGKDKAKLAESHRVADEVLAKLDEEPSQEVDHWRLATRAEALLLTGDIEGAASAYRAAVAEQPSYCQDHCVMRKQARRNLLFLPWLGGEAALDDMFPTYTVVVFWGSLVEPTGAPGAGIPEHSLPALRARLRDYLARNNVSHGFCVGARGPDLVFAEELAITAGRTVKLYLPCPRQAFLATLVGPAWQDTFDRLEQSPNLTVIAPQQTAPLDERTAWALCYRRMREAAVQQAELLDERVPATALSVADRRPSPPCFIELAFDDWERNGTTAPETLP